MIDLTSYTGVKSSLFVRLSISEYRTTPGGAFTSQVLRFSDHSADFDIDGETYTSVGNLLAVSNSSSELRTSSNDVTVTLSGIPNSAIAEIVNSKIKGEPVRIYRGYFDLSTGNIIGTVQGRFRGFVNNYSLNEDFSVDDRLTSNTIQLVCASSVDVLRNKTSGRKTNEQSQKSFYPTDVSFDRVTTLENTTFDFGKPD